jgi:molybdopterin biosynthesis enzyme
MGDRDFVPRALEILGAAVVFHRLPQRPGRPVLGALLADGKPVLALPGNPLSVLVTARRIATPVLSRLAGLVQALPPPSVTLDASDVRALDLWWHRLVRLTGPGRASLVEAASSGDFVAGARSAGFVETPPGATGTGPWPFYAWPL